MPREATMQGMLLREGMMLREGRMLRERVILHEEHAMPGDGAAHDAAH
jgi:hypothetical protein